MLFGAAILTVELIVSWLNGAVFTLRLPMNSYAVTLIRMVFIIAIYLLVLGRIESFTGVFLSRSLQMGQNVMGKFRGMVIIFTLVFFTLFVLYHKVWFNNYGPVEKVDGNVRPVFSELNRSLESIKREVKKIGKSIR